MTKKKRIANITFSEHPTPKKINVKKLQALAKKIAKDFKKDEKTEIFQRYHSQP